MQQEQEVKNQIHTYSNQQTIRWANEAKAKVKSLITNPQSSILILQTHLKKQLEKQKELSKLMSLISVPKYLKDIKQLIFKTELLIYALIHAIEIGMKQRVQSEVINIFTSWKKSYANNPNGLLNLHAIYTQQAAANPPQFLAPPLALQKQIKTILLAQLLTGMIKVQQTPAAVSSNIQPSMLKRAKLTEKKIEEKRKEIRGEILEHIENMDVENALEEEKSLFEDLKLDLLDVEESSKDFSEDKTIKNYLKLRFKIDLLRQYLFTDFLTITAQEGIRRDIFAQKKINAENYIGTNNDNNNPNYDSKNEYINYLTYKYMLEAKERQLLNKLTLSFVQYRKLIESASQLKKHELFLKIQLLTKIINKEIEVPGKGNKYFSFPELYTVDSAQYPEVLQIYQFVYFKKSKKVEKKLPFISHEEQKPIQRSPSILSLNLKLFTNNPNQFMHHSSKELAELNNNKNAQNLYEEGVALSQQLMVLDTNDPNASKLLEEAKLKLQQAADLGLSAAENYLQSNFSSLIMKFG